MKVYRLVKARHADEAVSGKGAQLYGGRWNPPGFEVVYAAESRALAVLEMFVHLPLEARDLHFLLYEITLPKGARSHRPRTSRPGYHPMRVTQENGRSWLERGTTLALIAPSVIVPQETNVVLNVRHPQFQRVRVSEPQPFSFDSRLWKG